MTFLVCMEGYYRESGECIPCGIGDYKNVIGTIYIQVFWFVDLVYTCFSKTECAVKNCQNPEKGNIPIFLYMANKELKIAEKRKYSCNSKRNSYKYKLMPHEKLFFEII